MSKIVRRVKWCFLAGSPEWTLAQCRTDLPRQLHVSLGQEAEAGTGSAEFGTTAMPASQDREVTTRLPLDLPLWATGCWPAAAQTSESPCPCTCGASRVLGCAPGCLPSASRSWPAAPCWLDLIPPMRVGCWESGKCSSFTFQTWRHMRI